MVTVEEYEDALVDLNAAIEGYRPISEYLRKINEVAVNGGRHRAFLEATFGLKQDRYGRSSFPDENYRLDLSKWPSVETVSLAGTTLAVAYNTVHELFAGLPREDRERVKPPPYHLEF